MGIEGEDPNLSPSTHPKIRGWGEDPLPKIKREEAENQDSQGGNPMLKGVSSAQGSLDATSAVRLGTGLVLVQVAW